MDVKLALRTLRKYRGEIDTHMREYFDSGKARLGLDLTENGEQALQELKKFSENPGKRLRGSLSMLSYEMCGGKNKQAALDLALSMELVQNYLLIIDDVMDRSIIRRGAPTVHENYAALISDDLKADQAKHISNMLAINVGLYAQHIASSVLANVNEDPGRVVKATQKFHENIAATGFGQIEDLYSDAYRVTEEETIFTVQRLKSSHYTFVNPLQTGAILAGQEHNIDVYHDFGIPAGIAYQLQDDYIGLFGDEDKTGKSATDDLQEGKMTLLILHALNNGSESQKSTILSVLGKANITPEEHESVRRIVIDTGSLEYSQSVAKQKADEASKVVGLFGWPDDGSDLVLGLIEYMQTREK